MCLVMAISEVLRRGLFSIQHDAVGAHHFYHEAILWIGVCKQQADAGQHSADVKRRPPCSLHTPRCCSWPLKRARTNAVLSLYDDSGTRQTEVRQRKRLPQLGAQEAPWIGSARHLGRHVENIQTDAASIINVGVIHWCNEAELWRLKRVTGRYVNGQSEHALLIDSAFWTLQVAHPMIMHVEDICMQGAAGQVYWVRCIDLLHLYLCGELIIAVVDRPGTNSRRRLSCQELDLTRHAGAHGQELVPLAYTCQVK